MRKVWAVIRREFVERVRSRWFIVMTVLGPIVMIGIGVLPSVLAMRGGKVNQVVVLDRGTGGLAARVQAQLARSGRFSAVIVESDAEHGDAAVESLTVAVQQESLDGFLTLDAAAIEAGTVEFRGRNVSALKDMGLLEALVRQSVVVERLNRRGIDPAMVQEAQSHIEIRTLRVTKRGVTGESGETTFLLGYIVGMVLYMVILLYGINVMRSVLEEKQTRIIEVLVSSLRPFQLMVGKVVGVASVGLLQFTVWSVVGWGMVRYRGPILGWFGVPATAVNAFRMPAISTELMLIVIAYFLLGYLLYAAAFAMVGASVTTDSEAQQAQMPVMWMLVAALILAFGALPDPAGQLSVMTSMIPVTSPIVMPVRAATSDVPTPQVLSSLGILATTLVLVVWVSARVYRIGILMYGKRPSLKELVRWARQS